MNDKKNSFVIILLGILSAIGPFSIDMYLPSFPSIASGLKISIAQVGYSLASYFIGISIGQLVYGPLVDRFGRKKPLIAGLFIYFVASILCAASPNIHILIGSRFILALGGCAGMVASRAIVRDLFHNKDIARVFSILTLVMGFAPIIAPTIGGFVNSLLGWRFIFLLLTLISAAMLFLVLKFLPETKSGDVSISFRPSEILKKYFEVTSNRQFILNTLAGGILFAGFFAYISGSPFVFIQLYGIPDSLFGLFFGINAAGYVGGSQINRLLIKRFKSGTIAMFFCSVQFAAMTVLIAGLFAGLMPKEASLVLLFIYIFGLGFTNPNTTALAIEPFTHNAGSASAMMGSIQMVIGASASGLVSLLFNGTRLPMFGIIASCAAVSFILLLLNRCLMQDDDGNLEVNEL
jgi:MFS transporter, DHA1 family, multidrug resistance protein